jgi:hypothetical protein
MCLFVELHLPGYSRREGGKLTTEVVDRGLLEVAARRQPKESEGALLFMGPRDNPCACNLGPEGDERSETYAFARERLDAIDSTVRYLASRAGPRGLTFRAAYLRLGTWEELPTPEEARVTLDALVKIIRAGRVRKNVRYVVGHDAA